MWDNVVKDIFFSGWLPIIRTTILGILGYIALLILLRISGKRTLTKMNSFDLVVTIAFGSMLAALLLNASVNLVQGIWGLSLLIGLQYLITFLGARYKPIYRLIKSEPTFLYYRGEFLHDAMYQERFMESELFAAVREQGYANFDEIDAVVLETNGQISVISSFQEGTDCTLEYVSNREDVGS